MTYFTPFGVMNIALPDFYNHYTPSGLLKFNCVTPILFSTRIIRLFAYGFISVILALYLAEIGLNEYQIGLLLSLTLAGDVAVSLWITTVADRIGRKRMLILGAALMVSAGAVFVFTKNPIPWCSRISRQIFCCAWFR